jgi:hypothetical protein
MPDEFEDAVDIAIWNQASSGSTRHARRARRRIARLVARLYGAASAPLRAKILAKLLRPLSPLCTVAVAAGAFAGFLHRAGSDGTRVALSEVGPYSTYSNEQIAELAHFVEQVDPDALMQIAGLVAGSPAGITALGVAAAMLLRRSLQGTLAARAITPAGHADDGRPGPPPPGS